MLGGSNEQITLPTQRTAASAKQKGGLHVILTVRERAGHIVLKEVVVLLCQDLAAQAHCHMAYHVGSPNETEKHDLKHLFRPSLNNLHRVVEPNSPAHPQRRICLNSAAMRKAMCLSSTEQESHVGL